MTIASALKIKWPRSTLSRLLILILLGFVFGKTVVKTWLESQTEIQPSQITYSAPLVNLTTPDSSVAGVTTDTTWFTNKESATVKRVVDGDTIELSDGRKLRYIGIDTPETVDPRKGVQCFGKEASQFNQQLVSGKEVWLEKDVSNKDSFGRLLRYVYVIENGQPTSVNQTLVAKGFAFSAAYPPDIKYQTEFKSLEAEARNNKLGLWADGACPTALLSPSPN